MTTTYKDRGSLYAAQAGVTIKTETHDHLPGKPTKTYAMGQDIPEYFECTFDSFGNICDVDGVVVYPSGSPVGPGRHHMIRGEHGYFGEFRENYGEDVYPELPSTRSMTLRAARKAKGLTMQQLSDASGVNIRQIARIEGGESKMSNVTLSNALALADALGVDVRDLL